MYQYDEEGGRVLPRCGGLPHASRRPFDRYPGEFGGCHGARRDRAQQSLVFSRIDRGHGFNRWSCRRGRWRRGSRCAEQAR